MNRKNKKRAVVVVQSSYELRDNRRHGSVVAAQRRGQISSPNAHG